MDWIIGDIVKTQGPSGLDPIFPPPQLGGKGGKGGLGGPCGSGGPGSCPMPPMAPFFNGLAPSDPPPHETLPQPRINPPMPPASGNGAADQTRQSSPYQLPTGPSVDQGEVAPADQGKETGKGWLRFRKKS